MPAWTLHGNGRNVAPNKVVRPDERINCEGGRYAVGNRTIRDAHPHGVLTFADVIAQ